MCPTSALTTLRIVVIRSVRTTRSVSFFLNRPSRSGAWLVFSIGYALLSKELLALGLGIWEEQPTVRTAPKLEKEPCEEITAKSRVTKHGRRSYGYRRRIKRMPYGGGIANVGVRDEMESHIDLIHGGSGEIAHLAYRRGGGVRRSDHLGSLGKLSTDHRRCWRHDPFEPAAHLSPISKWRIFPYQ
ncbi:hypothetical protein Acr_00g0018800 [Actinidia rufa]|uniref:Uncharacterized protein n=1 Tax=Actinidia rufa TaxID=165716 RepID=A0A7J0DBI7_9ERIC|nr:hypothetical protein Acr_00g0018800 [Actinidia rufa]